MAAEGLLIKPMIQDSMTTLIAQCSMVIVEGLMTAEGLLALITDAQRLIKLVMVPKGLMLAEGLSVTVLFEAPIKATLEVVDLLMTSLVVAVELLNRVPDKLLKKTVIAEELMIVAD